MTEDPRPPSDKFSKHLLIKMQYDTKSSTSLRFYPKSMALAKIGAPPSPWFSTVCTSHFHFSINASLLHLAQRNTNIKKSVLSTGTHLESFKLHGTRLNLTFYCSIVMFQSNRKLFLVLNTVVLNLFNAATPFNSKFLFATPFYSKYLFATHKIV